MFSVINNVNHSTASHTYLVPIVHCLEMFLGLRKLGTCIRHQQVMHEFESKFSNRINKHRKKWILCWCLRITLDNNRDNHSQCHESTCTSTVVYHLLSVTQKLQSYINFCVLKSPFRNQWSNVFSYGARRNWFSSWGSPAVKWGKNYSNDLINDVLHKQWWSLHVYSQWWTP